MSRPPITAATPRTLTHELMDLGLEPHVVATAVQIFGAMAEDASGAVTVRVDSGLLSTNGAPDQRAERQKPR